MKCRAQIILLTILGSACGAVAQTSVLAQPPATPFVPSAMQTFEANRAGEITSLETAPGAATQPASPFRWGPVNLRPHVDYQFLYGDGIPAAPGQARVTAINQISPGVTAEIGTHWILDYTPQLSYYSNKDFRDTVDHSVSLTGGTHYEDWILGLSQSYRSSSSSLIETAAQTEREEYATGFTSDYAFNSKLSTELALNQNISSAQMQSGWREWSLFDWMNYELAPKLQAALGAGGGYVNEETGADNSYEQLQGRIQWRVGEKLSLKVNGGAEERQYLKQGAASTLEPLFGCSVDYQPFEQTKLTLSADESLSASYYQNDLSKSTSVTAGLSQRLLGHFILGVSGSYHRGEFLSTSTGLASGRTDDNYSAQVRLGTILFKRLNVAVFYQYSENQSSLSLFQFTSNQMGLSLGYHY